VLIQTLYELEMKVICVNKENLKLIQIQFKT